MPKDKQVNIRITSSIMKQIDKIQSELEKENSIKFSRSQVIFMLIIRGIEKYTENQIA
jgi:hypothetical protein